MSTTYPPVYLFFTTEAPTNLSADNYNIFSDSVVFATSDVSFDKNTGVFSVDGQLIANQIRNRSDERLKHDISPIENALEAILQLQGKQYKLNSTGETQFGFIAQDVQPIIPSIVQSDNEYLTISYIELIPFLVESVKQLHSENNALKRHVAEMDATLSNINQQLAALMRKFE
tara:strand:- start:17 stop:535 length:519 start_codon:yes stop_codon:yes gene_type:complete